MTDIQKQLFEMQDLGYRDFHSKLMPTVDKQTVIGIRIPPLRKFAKDFAKTPQAAEFMRQLPHEYYEENNLHAFLIEQIKDYSVCIEELERFLPYVDNWATSDLMSPKVFKKHRPELLLCIRQWIKSDRTYTIRYGVGMLMAHFLDEDFDLEYPELVAAIRSEEYYVNMMLAWYFATALAKQYDEAVKYIEGHRLDKWTHNKAIQKSIESFRVTDEHKAYLKSLKRK